MCGFWEGRPPCRPNLPLRSSSAVRAEADPPLSRFDLVLDEEPTKKPAL